MAVTAREKAVNGLWKLPEGWEWQYLEEVAQVYDGPRQPIKRTARVSGPVPYCGANGVIDSVKGFTHEGDFVLLAEDGGFYGPGEASSYRMEGKFWANNHVHILRGKEALLDNGWLEFVLMALDLRGYLTGATRPKLPQSAMRRILLPVPSRMDTQRRIIARIESIIAEVKRARELLKQMRSDIERLIASVLVETFEGLPTRSSDWQEEPVSQFCHKPQYGYTESANWEAVGPKFLRITDIQDSKVNWDTVPYCHIPNVQLSRYLLASSDILFARSGATTGKTFLVQECPLAVFASYLIRVRVREKVCPDFLAWFFRSPKYWSQIQPRGAAQPNMNAKLLEQIRVPYPKSPEIQRQIVSYLGSTQTGLDRMQNLLDQDARLLDQIAHSILERAFRGEL